MLARALLDRGRTTKTRACQCGACTPAPVHCRHLIVVQTNKVRAHNYDTLSIQLYPHPERWRWPMGMRMQVVLHPILFHFAVTSTARAHRITGLAVTSCAHALFNTIRRASTHHSAVHSRGTQDGQSGIGRGWLDSKYGRSQSVASSPTHTC